MAPARFPLGLSLGRAFTLGAIIGGALTAPPLQAGSPRLTSVYPSVGQRGTEQEVVFGGLLLADARTALFDAPGFEVTVVKAEATRCTARIKIPADARVGEHRFRVVTQSGVSDLRFFHVSPFPVVEEANPKDAAGAAVRTAQRTAARAAAKAAHAEAVAKAAAEGKAPPPPPAPEAPLPEGPQLVPINTTVFGRVPGEDVDRWSVDLAAGQRLSVEVAGFQLQPSSFDPELVVEKPDGTVWKTVGGTVFGRGNPVFSVQVPETGRYTISVRDITQAAAASACHYFMHIGDYPRPLGVLPTGAEPGKRDDFVLLGGGLSKEKAGGLVVDLGGGYGGLFLDGTTPSPVPVRVSSLPNFVEKEQVESPSEAKDAVPLPAAFSGVISKKGEVDYFRFAAKKSQTFNISVHARALRSRLDSILEVYSAAGAKLGSNDDLGGPDSFLRWVAPSDGEFVVAIKDQQGRGGDEFHYRIELDTVKPKVKAYLPEMVINSSQERRAVVVPQGNRFASMIRVKREDFPGALDFQALNLPAGVRVSGGQLTKGGDTALMVFEAAADAPLDQRLFNLKGVPVQEPEAGAVAGAAPAQPVEPVTPQVEVEHFISTVEIGNAVPLHRIKESALPIAVSAPVPVSIAVDQPKEPAMRGAAYPLKIKVERKNEFKGPVEVSLLYAPTGISTAGPVKVPEDVSEVELPLSVAPAAALGKGTLCVQATLDPGSGRVWIGSNLFDLETAEAPISGTLVRCSIQQGASGVMKMKVTAKTEFKGKLKVELFGLPNGVTSEAREVDAETTEVEFPLKATAEASVGLLKQVIAQLTIARSGVNLVATCASGGILRVDRGSAPAKTSSTAAAEAISVAKSEPSKAAGSQPGTVPRDETKPQSNAK